MKKIFTFLMVCLVGILGVFGLTSCGKENFDNYQKIEYNEEIMGYSHYVYTCTEDEMSEGETKNKTKLVFIFNADSIKEAKAVEFEGEVLELEKQSEGKVSGNFNFISYTTKKEFVADYLFFDKAVANKVYYIDKNDTKTCMTFDGQHPINCPTGGIWENLESFAKR